MMNLKKAMDRNKNQFCCEVLRLAICF